MKLSQSETELFYAEHHRKSYMITLLLVSNNVISLAMKKLTF